MIYAHTAVGGLNTTRGHAKRRPLCERFMTHARPVEVICHRAWNNMSLLYAPANNDRFSGNDSEARPVNIDGNGRLEVLPGRSRARGSL